MLVLGLLVDLSEMERKTPLEQFKSSLEQGKVLGRKPGTSKPDALILKENRKVADYLQAGRSVRETTKLCDIAPNTVMKAKRIIIS